MAEWHEAYPPGTRAQFRVDRYTDGGRFYVWEDVVVTKVDEHGVVWGHQVGDPTMLCGWSSPERWRLMPRVPTGVWTSYAGYEWSDPGAPPAGPPLTITNVDPARRTITVQLLGVKEI